MVWTLRKPALLTRMSIRPNASIAVLDHALDVGGVADVGLDGDGFASDVFDGGDERFGDGRAFVVVAGDVGALAGEGERDLAADAAAGAGDECDFAVEFAHQCSF